jgi:hypothetical protein
MLRTIGAMVDLLVEVEPYPDVDHLVVMLKELLLRLPSEDDDKESLELESDSDQPPSKKRKETEKLEVFTQEVEQ